MPHFRPVIELTETDRQTDRQTNVLGVVECHYNNNNITRILTAPRTVHVIQPATQYQGQTDISSKYMYI